MKNIIKIFHLKSFFSLMKHFILISHSLTLVSSCAHKGKVVVRTNPPDALVYLIDLRTGQNALLGKTPYSFDRIEKSKQNENNSDILQLRIEKDGFEPQYTAVTAFGGETTYLDVQLQTVGQSTQKVKKAFEESRALLQEALRLILSKRYSDALFKIEKIIEMDPKNSEAYAAKGSVLYLMKDLEGAKTSWTKALELNPSNDTVRACLLDLNFQSQKGGQP